MRIFVLFLVFTLVIVVGVVFAGHNGGDVSYETGDCGETTFSATVADPAGTHKVSNMYMVVDVDGAAQYANIPIDGSAATITVGPFFGQDPTVSWNVFGGGERSYDQPLWNGYGSPTFGADISSYAASVGGYSWVIAGTNDPNPFVNWNEISVESCAITVDMCKNGGWEAFDFRNQGQCIRFVNTGFDSR
jgi:hypothetical protein